MTDASTTSGDHVLQIRSPDHPDSVSLLQAFHREQISRYGFAESIDLDPATYAAPNGVFIVVYRSDEPVGCGGCRWFDRTTGRAEIKKVFLVTEARRRGIGRALLSRLEATASSLGAAEVILETGIRNADALSLFTGAGYRPTAGYVAGRDPAINRAFTKALG